LLSLDLVKSKYDTCLYFTKCLKLFVTIYVDDLGLWGDEVHINWFVGKLSKLFDVRVMGEISSLLNLNIRRVNSGTITVDQSLEIETLLKEHNMLQCNGHYSPLNIDIFDIIEAGGSNRERWDESQYRRVIGNLLYLANRTRPDLAFAVSFLSQFCQHPL